MPTITVTAAQLDTLARELPRLAQTLDDIHTNKQIALDRRAQRQARIDRDNVRGVIAALQLAS